MSELTARHFDAECEIAQRDATIASLKSELSAVQRGHALLKRQSDEALAAARSCM